MALVLLRFYGSKVQKGIFGTILVEALKEKLFTSFERPLNIHDYTLAKTEQRVSRLSIFFASKKFQSIKFLLTVILRRTTEIQKVTSRLRTYT